MRLRTYLFTLALLVGFALTTSNAFAIGDHSQHSQKGDKDKKDKNDKSKEKPFEDMIEDRVAIEGLFTFYHDTTDNTMLMSISADQIGPIFICGESRTAAEGLFYDNGSMQGSFPFYFKRVGKKIMMMEKNLRIRADSTNPMFDAVTSGISDHLIASVAIKSKPQDSTEAVLIDPSALFVKDAGNTGYFLGQRGRTGVRFDAKNSYFYEVKSFPNNTEVAVKLHFSTSKPQSGTTMQNPYSFYHTYHYSLSKLPESDFVPRLADDRVGHFLTAYQDYNRLDTETPYVRYIDRWHLTKKDPDARISEPETPIVYWVDKNTPEEYRDAVAEGIEFWNPAFEKIGFRNAIVAKQMPDSAEWDPADVRYSVVQWMVQPGAGYAVGPHQANPFTGEIYDADIRVSTDFIRYMFSFAGNYLAPLTFDGNTTDGSNPFEENSLPEMMQQSNNPYACTYGAESAREAGAGLAYLTSIGDFADKDSLTKEYVHAYLVELIAHEVGHTLGLRHNFKASTIYTLEQLSDKEFTRKHSTCGTVMDYMPPNVRLDGLPQGEFYSSVPGPYDDWVIAYAYTQFDSIATPQDELPLLEKIASRAPEHNLRYATDEDAFGSSMKSVDPLVNLHDLGADPLEYAKHQIKLSRTLWLDAIKKFETTGTRYQKLYRVFQSGWRGFYNAARIPPKYVGGLDHSRSHIGDPGGKLPFEPIPAAQQREAVAFLRDNLFAADAFDVPAQLLNKLELENLEDFSFSAYTRPQVDYPFHQMVLNVQNTALRNLYSPYVLGRLLNNLERVKDGDDVYTMYDLFTEVRRSIWGEITSPEDVNSFRRQLQLVHLNRLVSIYLTGSGVYPADARTLAANDLDVLADAAASAAGSSAINGMTRAHFKEVVRQIDAAKKARREYSQR